MEHVGGGGEGSSVGDVSSDRYALLSRYRSGRRGSGGCAFVYLVSFEVMEF